MYQMGVSLSDLLDKCYPQQPSGYAVARAQVSSLLLPLYMPLLLSHIVGFSIPTFSFLCPSISIEFCHIPHLDASVGLGRTAYAPPSPYPLSKHAPFSPPYLPNSLPPPRPPASIPYPDASAGHGRTACPPPPAQ